MSEWFTTTACAPGVWAIEDHGHDTCYLVTGERQALLIDTGWGFGDLAGLVATLTALPLTVVNTHGHPDHATGNAQFPTAHLHPADQAMLRGYQWGPEQRAWAFDRFLGKLRPESFDADRWGDLSRTTLLPLTAGQRFDLGGRTLEVRFTPGHTAGSICLLDRDARLLFSGDTLHAGILWLHLEESRPLHEFHETLRRLRETPLPFDTLLPGHGLPCPVGDLLDSYIAGIGEILAGDCTGAPTETFAGVGLQCEFAVGGLLYRADRL